MEKPIPNCKRNQQQLPQIVSPPSASEQTIQTRKVINITTERNSMLEKDMRKITQMASEPSIQIRKVINITKKVPNPWQVESIHEFYFLKCPECTFDTKEENCFQDHALENHPLSCVLFDIKSKEDSIEFNEDSLLPEDHNYCESKKNASPSQNFVIDIKEEFRVDENDPLDFCNSIANDGVDEINSTDYEGENIFSCETFVEPKIFNDIQNEPNPKSSSKKDEVVLNQSMDFSKSPKSSKNHQRSPENGQNLYEIGLNDLSRKTRDILKESLNISNEELVVYQCSICTSSFESSRRLSLHVAAAHEEKKPIKCYICELSFPERNLKAHFTSAREGNKPFKCSICDSCFSHNQKLKIHVAAVHEGQKPFKCTVCDASFSSNGYVKNHIESVHEKKKPFQCTQCEACFSLNSTLKKHIESVHEKKRPSLCSDCGKSFYSPDNLRKHISSVHEKKKPFICSHCSKSFALKGQLQKHTAAVHEGKKDFQCSLCGHCFSQKKDMKLHIASVHEGKKPYKCTKCDKSFSQNVNLKEHLLVVHEGKKPHQCSNCDASFSRKSKLKEHAVSVHMDFLI